MCGRDCNNDDTTDLYFWMPSSYIVLSGGLCRRLVVGMIMCSPFSCACNAIGEVSPTHGSSTWLVTIGNALCMCLLSWEAMYLAKTNPIRTSVIVCFWCIHWSNLELEVIMYRACLMIYVCNHRKPAHSVSLTIFLYILISNVPLLFLFIPDHRIVHGTSNDGTVPSVHCIFHLLVGFWMIDSYVTSRIHRMGPCYDGRSVHNHVGLYGP